MNSLHPNASHSNPLSFRAKKIVHLRTIFAVEEPAFQSPGAAGQQQLPHRLKPGRNDKAGWGGKNPNPRMRLESKLQSQASLLRNAWPASSAADNLLPRARLPALSRL